MNNVKTYRHFRLLKAAGWVLLVIFILGLTARLLLKASFIHNFVKHKIESIAAEQLNGSLKIDKLDGDLWSKARITGLLITDPDTVVSIDTLYAEYEVLSVLKEVFQIRELSLSGITANITETDTARFNIQHLIKQDAAEPDKDDGKGFYFNLQAVNVTGLNSRIYSPSYLPDDKLEIQNLNLEAAFQMAENISGSLSRLEFSLREGRLPEPVHIRTAAAYHDERITLRELVLETSRSLLQAGANLTEDLDEIEGGVVLSPLATKDLAPYLDAVIPDDNLQIKLSAEGNKNRLGIGLNLKSGIIEEADLSVVLTLTGTPELRELTFTGRNADFSGFMEEPAAAGFKNIRFSSAGELTQNLALANIDWDFKSEGLVYDHILIPELRGQGTLRDNILNGEITAVAETGGSLVAEPFVSGLFSEHPEWEARLRTQDLNLAVWLNSPEMKTDLTLRAEAGGKGFALSEELWSYSVATEGEKNTIQDFSLTQFTASGSVNAATLTLESRLSVAESSINLRAAGRNYMTDNPAFDYSVAASSLNLAHFIRDTTLSTSLNLTLEGSGRGFAPETMELQGTFSSAPGSVNGALIDKTEFNYRLGQGVIHLDSGEVISDFADASFILKQNLFDAADTENQLAFDLTLKDLQPLAPLLNADTLKAGGTLKGTVSLNQTGKLNYKTTLNLHEIQFDDLFYADSAAGRINTLVSESQRFDASLNLSGLLVYGASMQDVSLDATADLGNSTLKGGYTLSISGSERSQFIQNGFFESLFSENKHTLELVRFDVISPQSVMEIQNPFHLSYENGVLKTDTLSLAADDGAFFTLFVPYADSLRQEAGLSGLHFDLGTIQDVLLDERFADGILSGSLNFHQNNGELKAGGEILLEALNYKGTVADSVAFNFDVADERAKATGAVVLNNKKILEGNLDIPFVLADSQLLPDAFFELPVQGSLNVYTTNLSDFEPIFEAFNITNTGGYISFRGELAGVAGEPDINGRLSLSQPVLSGIKMDSVSVGFGYHHNNKRFNVDAEIMAIGQKAVEADIEIPFSYNFRTFEINPPEKDEVLTASLKTGNFNLAALNDFLDKKYTRNLKGILDGTLTLTGTGEELSLDGNMKLTGASLEVPVANITLNDARSTVSFSKNGIQIREFYTKSGKGDFKASGMINMDGLTPTTLNLNAAARQFRLINTKDYNMTVDLDSKIAGKATSPKTTGKLTIKNGFVFLTDFGDKYVEDVQLPGEEESFSPYDSLALDMQFVIERNFFVRNRRYLDMEVELTGNLDAVKETAGDLQLFGSLEGVRGYVKPLGKMFNLDEAGLTFSGPLNDPEFNIRSSYQPNQNQDPVTLYYVIEGTAQSPKFSFESDPPMEQQDIISYTLFGRPFYALDSWERTVSNSNTNAASDLLMNILLDEVESLATRELGIDVVQIESIRSGTETGTSIKTGWYVNNRTFFAIVNEIGTSDPKTLFLLEYMLNKNLDLILTQGDNAREGIDLRWKFDY